MNKKLLFCLLAFSALSILGFVLTMVCAIIVTRSVISMDLSKIEDKYMWLNITSSVVNGISIIGSLVCGILVLMKSKTYEGASGLAKATGIVAIVGGGLGIFTSMITLMFPQNFSIGTSIIVVVAFGLCCATLAKVKKIEAKQN